VTAPSDLATFATDAGDERARFVANVARAHETHFKIFSSLSNPESDFPRAPASDICDKPRTASHGTPLPARASDICDNSAVLSEAEVRAVARERGYKAGWCRHYLREQAARSAQ
jgi:hypothetical protein